jgi:hypothetical protein
MNQRAHQNKSPWVNVKMFSKDGLSVQVEMLDGWRPRYRVRLGALRGEDFLPTILVRLEGQGKVQIHRVQDTVSALLTEAEDWVHNEAQHRENQILEERIVKETKQVNFGKPVARVTGKTQKNRDKRKVATA